MSTFNFAEMQALADDRKVPRRLTYIYGQVPESTCKRNSKCCFNCAEVHLIEYLAIQGHIKTLPHEDQAHILSNALHYELLSLLTLDYSCPFHRGDDCLVYEVRPLQCRFYGLYPDQEYRELKEESRKGNQELGELYFKSYGIKLPEEILTYDVDQCPNNVDADGNRIVVGSMERDRLTVQMQALQDSVLGDIDPLPARSRYSHYLASQHFDEEYLLKLKIVAMKEYQHRKSTELLESIVERILEEQTATKAG